MRKLKEDTIRELANCWYERQMREYRDRLAAEEAVVLDRLGDNGYATALGLPADLPEHTRNVLKVTMALDVVGPSLPKRDEIHRKYGL